jgi:hypothetical protein
MMHPGMQVMQPVMMPVAQPTKPKSPARKAPVKKPSVSPKALSHENACGKNEKKNPLGPMKCTNHS